MVYLKIMFYSSWGASAVKQLQFIRKSYFLQQKKFRVHLISISSAKA